MSNGLLMRRRLSSKMDLRLTQDDGMAVLAMALLVFQGRPAMLHHPLQSVRLRFSATQYSAEMDALGNYQLDVLDAGVMGVSCR